MPPAPNSLSTALLERRRAAFGGGYVFHPGEYFPIEVEPILFGGSLRLYIPVLVDDLLRQQAQADRILRAFRAFRDSVEEEDERAEAAAQLLARFGDATKAAALFYGLGYEITLRYEIRQPRPSTMSGFLDRDLGVQSRAALRRIASRFPSTHAFAETLIDMTARQDRVEAFQQEFAFPTVNSLLIIEREIAFFIVGGQVLRVGKWVIDWAREAQAVITVVEKVVRLAEMYKPAATSLALLDEALSAARAIGHRLMQLVMVVGFHQALLEIVPLFARLESLLADYIAAEIEARAEGALAANGWIVDEDDPVDMYFVELVMQTPVPPDALPPEPS